MPSVTAVCCRLHPCLAAAPTCVNGSGMTAAHRPRHPTAGHCSQPSTQRQGSSPNPHMLGSACRRECSCGPLIKHPLHLHTMPGDPYSSLASSRREVGHGSSMPDLRGLQVLPLLILPLDACPAHPVCQMCSGRCIAHPLCMMVEQGFLASRPASIVYWVFPGNHKLNLMSCPVQPCALQAPLWQAS